MNKNSLGAFALAMISISAILSVRGLPLMAVTGWHSVFFYLLAAFTFLIPSAMVCAKLAGRYSENGGIYTWIKQAFGQKTATVAIWLEWINNVIAYPATLATIISTVAYLGFPNLEQHRIFLFSAMMLILWGLIAFNNLQIGITSRLNIFGALLGTLLPCALLIIIGAVMLTQHFQIALPIFNQHFLPPLNTASLAVFVSVLSSYGGMQVIAFHARNVRDPKKTFPRAIVIATVAIIFTSILATLAIALIIPAAKINLLNGLIEAAAIFFKQIHLPWLIPIFSVLIAFGTLASLNAWVIGPARGLQTAAENGDMPRFLAKTNRYQMPVRVLCVQGIIGTLLASFFLWMPTLKAAFWVLIALTSQFTLVVYLLMFAASIKLTRNSFFATLGIISSCVGFYLGLFPPDQLNWLHLHKYIGMMLFIDGLIILMPILYNYFSAERISPRSIS